MGLTSLHTIFIRLHNQFASSLSKINPQWPDDIIYYETRRIVSAIIQHITYEEFLPLLIGRSHSNFGVYQYNSSVRLIDDKLMLVIISFIGRSDDIERICHGGLSFWSYSRQQCLSSL